MGVLGLWQLLSPVGQPVTLESLENKIFAVDISIWLNQALKGYRDSQGGAVPNAHLLSLFSRLCKLLFYKIRPIVVFDGGFPELKKQTIINRQQRRAAAKQNSSNIGLKILTNYIASQQLGNTADLTNSNKASFKTKAKPSDEIFKLPPLPECSQNILSNPCESNDDYGRQFTSFSKEDIKYLNQIDIESEDFNSLPPDVKQEILSTLKESRKHRTWDQYDELPQESNDFSNYQMQCLLKKRKLQSKLEEVQKYIRQINSSAYVSQYTNDHVIGETNKIMSDDTSYYVLLKKLIDKKESNTKQKSLENIKPSTSVMANAKSAFIRDVENIDLEEDYFSGDSSSYKNIQITNETVKIKSEINSLDLSDEEYNIDNPPFIGQIIEKNNQTTELENLQRVNKNAVEDLVVSQNINLTDEECIDYYNTKHQVEYQKGIDALKSETNEFHSEIPLEENKCSSENKIAEVKISSRDETEPYNEIGVVEQFQNNISVQSKTNKNYFPLEIESSTPVKNDGITEIECQSNIVLEEENKIEQKMHSDSEDCIAESDFNDIYSQSSHSQSTSTSMLVDEMLLETNLELQKNLNAATEILEYEQAKQNRQSNTVQDHIIEECKELLHLFGIPYVVSPLEAEAQCAFYDVIDFTHGTITDDSDVWLFGGKRVYKNFFTQQKFVECYKDKEIFSHFGLSRNKLINFALLTGSDYTEGIEGVGPVTAMEIISEFPGEGFDSLQKFKNWWQESIKHSRPPENKVRAKLKKLVLPENFPDDNVFEAYLNPEIDASREKFTWGRPDLDALRDFTKERFGWNQNKVDSALLPVLKKLNERDKQTHLDSYFTVNLKKEKQLFPSKRIMSALKKITSPQKQETDKNTEKIAVKRKSKKSFKNVNPKKVIRKVSVVRDGDKKRTIKSQGPVLSEESSSDS